MLRAAIILVVAILFLLLIESRGHPAGYFSTRCIDYRQTDYSRKLNDRIVDYADEAKRKGISPSSNNKELRRNISSGKLARIRTNQLYIVDRMTYSYPALTPDSGTLLGEIARRFREKTTQKGLYGCSLHITSMTRETDDIRRIRRDNGNSSVNSPHLYGNAFDISYKRFSVRKMFLTNCDSKFLKEALAQVIWELRVDGKCWATYERMQNCFHVVAR